MASSRNTPCGIHRHAAKSSPDHGLRSVSRRAGVKPLPRWISVAGMEFGTESEEFSSATPGRAGEDWFINGRKTYGRLAEAGFRTFRIPFSWERLQPELGGPLNPEGVQALRFQLNLAHSFDAQVILDLHNQGRFARGVEGRVEHLVLGEERHGHTPLGPSQLADFWARMAHAFKSQPAIAGYGLMNEPHDLPAGAWVQASSEAAEAIRGEGDPATLYVAGDRWSSVTHWDRVNPSSPWIHDSLGEVVYEGHCYLDQNGSGKYPISYAEELAFDPEVTTRAEANLTPFLEWLETNGARGFLGEFAVPVRDPAWCALLRPMLERLDAASVQSAWWAAGEYWGDYPLSLQPGKRGETPRPAEVELFLD
jgi:endoglucanase